MKRVINLSFLVVAIVSLVACSPTTPGKALKSYLTDLKNENYESFIKGVYFPEDMDEQRKKKDEAQLLAIIKEKGAKEYEKKGGVKSIEILSETISEDGKSAVVEYKQTFGNGEEEKQSQKMIKKDDKWFIDMRK
ncbi:DUF4878 domain-containing protein [Bacteroides ndongoniae]|uniref:DUF4878 domain-containing protein n=1 Tax=Bacteroides ndongoniae TaxID=1903262 RepID=UPI0023F78BBE|nr:DUF4878 domain-containing protein [Bacteroides ndongoniae]